MRCPQSHHLISLKTCFLPVPFFLGVVHKLAGVVWNDSCKVVGFVFKSKRKNFCPHSSQLDSLLLQVASHPIKVVFSEGSTSARAVLIWDSPDPVQISTLAQLMYKTTRKKVVWCFGVVWADVVPTPRNFLHYHVPHFNFGKNSCRTSNLSLSSNVLLLSKLVLSSLYRLSRR